MKKIKKFLIFIYWDLLYRLFYIFPLKDKIFFESFLGESYSCNPRGIYEYLIKNNYDYKYVWSLRDPSKVQIKEAKVIKKMRIRYLYHLATSKYIINNSRMPLKWNKRKGQIFVQTWHGTPLKRLVYDMEKINMPLVNKDEYLKNFTKDVKKWDYLISPNEYSTSKFKSAFKYDGKIIKSGYPRNERLKKVDVKKIDDIKKKIGIPLDKKVILYTPTYRDNLYINKGRYIQDIFIDMDKLKKAVGEDVVMILKSHYLVKEINYKYSKENIIDLSLYDDITDLYLISDLLITDYSSTFFDYIYLNKPIVFYQYDQKEYEEDIRGFYIPINDLENVVKSESQLYDIISKLNIKEKYDYKNFLLKYDIIDYLENSSEFIIKEVIERK